MATRESRLQLLHGGLKRVQERGARYQVADELRISALPLDDRAWTADISSSACISLSLSSFFSSFWCSSSTCISLSLSSFFSSFWC